mmetsp:Transcript_18264/g.28079  ORF Transcript_18264/g.28079 Transcript_18264/m.28079 type:complete len:148 (+) Transcript_18264:1243-1686(+)
MRSLFDKNGSLGILKKLLLDPIPPMIGHLQCRLHLLQEGDCLSVGLHLSQGPQFTLLKAVPTKDGSTWEVYVDCKGGDFNQKKFCIIRSVTQAHFELCDSAEGSQMKQYCFISRGDSGQLQLLLPAVDRFGNLVDPRVKFYVSPSKA